MARACCPGHFIFVCEDSVFAVYKAVWYRFLRSHTRSLDDSRDISDASHFLNTAFGGGAPYVCDDACDAEDNRAHPLQDAFAILDAVFQGVPLPAPYPACGLDPTNDSLTCDQQLVCP